jgi:murein DD-endopeptidase MepM/ murein hydrolase activator NlpD
VEQTVPESETGAAIRAEIMADAYPPAENPAGQTPGQDAASHGAATQAGIDRPQNPDEEKSAGFRGTSWQGAGMVSATPKPVSSFKSNGAGAVEGTETAATRPRGMVPEETLWPYEGKIVSGFGWEDTPGGGRRWNSGVTMEGAPGDPVQAVLDGTVIFSGQRDGYGHTVILEHQGGFLSYYGNVSPGQFNEGDTIQRGTNFAKIDAQPLSGQSGENSAPLFFELKRGEMALNPEAAIRRLTVAGR